MQKIVPHLWYDMEAVEAANFYVSVFGGDSTVTNVTKISGTPSGDCDIVNFKLWGYEFMSISAGPYFKPTPAISFMVNFDPIRYKASNGAGPSQEEQAKADMDRVWAKLSEGGAVMMELAEYPFSKRYGWCADKYGFSWQLILTNPEGEERPRIIPSMLFANKKYGKAEEAVDFYLSVFKESKLGTRVKYPANTPPHTEGSVMFSDFKLLDSWFVAMDGPGEHAFDFGEAVSLIVNCDTQEEIDYYWEKLSAVPESEQCGWLKDKYGVSWQIVPSAMNEMMATKDKAALGRVTEAFLKMKKFIIADLEKAYKG